MAQVLMLYLPGVLIGGLFVAAYLRGALPSSSEYAEFEARCRQMGDTYRALILQGLADPNPHLDHEVIPVESLGEVVAHLCVTCDRQLPAEWPPVPPGPNSLTG